MIGQLVDCDVRKNKIVNSLTVCKSRRNKIRAINPAPEMIL